MKHLHSFVLQPFLLLCLTALLAVSNVPKPALSPHRRSLSAFPVISQNPGLPNGCECVSAAMVLQYYGFSCTPEALVEDYLPMESAPYWLGDNYVGGNPNRAFLGDPRSTEGWGCYAPVLCGVLQAYLADHGPSGMRVYPCSGVPLEALCTQYIDNDIPVILWATMDMSPVQCVTTWTTEDGTTTASMPYPMHCLVLVGYTPEAYVLADPWYGELRSYPKESVETAYAALGQQTVLLMPLPKQMAKNET